MDFKPVCDSTLSITQRLFTDRITRAVSENTAISVTPTHGTQEDVKKPQPPAHTAFHIWGNEREFSDCERIPTSTQQCFGIARPHRTAHLVIGVFQKLNRALSKRNGMSKERDARRDVRRVVLQRKEKQMRIFLQSNTAPRPATQEPRARFAQDLRWKKRLRMTADVLHEAQATLQTSSVRSRCRPPAPRATPDTERRSPRPRPSAALSGRSARCRTAAPRPRPDAPPAPRVPRAYRPVGPDVAAVAQLEEVAEAEREGGGGQQQGQRVADGGPLQQAAAHLQQAQHRLALSRHRSPTVNRYRAPRGRALQPAGPAPALGWSLPMWRLPAARPMGGGAPRGDGIGRAATGAIGRAAGRGARGGGTGEDGGGRCPGRRAVRRLLLCVCAGRGGGDAVRALCAGS